MPFQLTSELNRDFVTQGGITDRLPPVQEHPMFYVAVYAGIGLISLIISVTATATQYLGALRASRILFKQLLTQVVRATMRWHDVTPTGTLLMCKPTICYLILQICRSDVKSVQQGMHKEVDI